MIKETYFALKTVALQLAKRILSLFICSEIRLNFKEVTKKETKTSKKTDRQKKRDTGRQMEWREDGWTDGIKTKRKKEKTQKEGHEENLIIQTNK